MDFKFPEITPEYLRKCSINAYLLSRRNKTCISYWYPKILKCLPEIKMPETALIYLSCEDAGAVLDNKKTDNFKYVVDKIKKSASIFGYPCFLKTGLFSGKHNWKDCCFIGNENDIEQHLINIIFEAAAVDCNLTLHIAIRKMIKTAPIFTAFEGQMPVTCERRYFVKEGKVYFHHPYWPPFSIQNPSIEDWQIKLDEINTEHKDEIHYLTEFSEQVGALLGEGWSIDWLKDADGNWWLTDMAEDYKSFMWEDYKPKLLP